jgi:hypothetical protein
MSRPGVLAAAALAATAIACQAESGTPAPPVPPPERLVRAGATAVETVAGDLDGDGVEEVAISSVSAAADEFGIATPYLEVFDVRDGHWTRVFDATGSAPHGGGAPPHMLAASGEGFVGQSVQTLEVVDFAGDGRPEMVAGIANFGATTGPLELWIVSMGDAGGLATELYRDTARGGEIVVEDDRLRFEYAVYRRHDPGCCPTFTDTLVIGWNEASGRIEVLERTRRPSGLG